MGGIHIRILASPLPLHDHESFSLYTPTFRATLQAWVRLEAAEHEREVALRKELMRYLHIILVMTSCKCT